MYHPQYIDLPPDVYLRCLNIANAYDELCRRKADLDQAIAKAADLAPQLLPCREQVGRYIEAVDDAIEQTAVDQTERKIIVDNLIKGIRMTCIAVPASLTTKKRVRKRFLEQLARNLYEVY